MTPHQHHGFPFILKHPVTNSQTTCQVFYFETFLKSPSSGGSAPVSSSQIFMVVVSVKLIDHLKKTLKRIKSGLQTSPVLISAMLPWRHCHGRLNHREGRVGFRRSRSPLSWFSSDHSHLVQLKRTGFISHVRLVKSSQEVFGKLGRWFAEPSVQTDSVRFIPASNEASYRGNTQLLLAASHH